MEATNRLIGYGDETRFGASRSALVFHHIPKCGGTTLGTILAARFALRPFFARPREELADIAASPGDVLVQGHSVWGIHELLDPGWNVFYLTLLRDPWSICLSHFRYAARTMFHTNSLEAWVRDYRNDVLVDSLASGDLEAAKQRLAEDVFCFGVVERFDQFLGDVASRFDLGPVRYQTRNVSRSDEPAPPEPLRRRFERDNALDRELYHWALDLLEARRASVAPVAQVVRETRSEPMRTSAPKLLDAYRRRDLQTVIRALRALPTRSVVELGRLLRCLLDVGEVAEAEALLTEDRERHGHIHPGLLSFYLEISPDAAIGPLRRELGYLAALKRTRWPSAANDWRRRTWSALASALERSGELDAAADALEQAAQTGGRRQAHDEARVHAALARDHASRSRRREPNLPRSRRVHHARCASRAYRAALALAPGSARVLKDFVAFLLARERADEALDVLAQASAAGAPATEVALLRAAVHEATADPGEALQVLEVLPRAEQHRFEVALALARLRGPNDPEGALALLRSLRPDADQVRAHRQALAVALHRLGRSAGEDELLVPGAAPAPPGGRIPFGTVLSTCATKRTADRAGAPLKIALIRSAPMLLFERLADELSRRGERALHVLTRADSIEKIGRHPAVERVYAMPDRGFRDPADRAALAPEVFETRFDLVIVLLSHWDEAYYRDILALSRGLRARHRVAYELEQLATPEERHRFRLLSDGGRPLAAGRTRAVAAWLGAAEPAA